MGNSNFSLEQINKLTIGDPKFKKELIEIFLGQIPEFISTMTRCLDQKNFKELSKTAHTAKSSAMVFGMNVTGEKLKKIQLDTEKGEIRGLKELIESVAAEFEEAKKNLELKPF